MSIMIFQPQGTGTATRIGTVIVQAPVATGWFSANYKLDSAPESVPSPATGVSDRHWNTRFDDTTYYTT